MSPRNVRNELSPYLPTAAMYEAIRFMVTRDDAFFGTLALLHGHQGTAMSDRFSWLSRLALPGYRLLQRLTGVGRQTPARDACLRGTHDREMHDWARSQEQVILVAGHTHRPVWGGLTHLQQLEWDLALLMNRPDTQQHDDRIRALARQILERRRRDEEAGAEPCNDRFGASPAYFNTGCCKFEDGDITGIELVDGELRLIKWNSLPAPTGPIVLERGQLEGWFGRL